MILRNNKGVSLELVPTGGAIRTLFVPDRNGVLRDVVLGRDKAEDYPYGCFGTFIGRYGNRIAGSAFPLNGKIIHITPNEGKNCLHGGSGFHSKRFDMEAEGEQKAILHYVSPDGEDGFPGTMQLTITVTLSEENELTFLYEAVSDQDTVVNLTNHSYFNLSGEQNILGHELMIDADRILEVDKGLIPTGTLLDVSGTDFDFRQRRPIVSGKYDHCYVLNSGEGVKAEVYSPVSGIGMQMKTDLPGMQLYCGMGTRGAQGKNGQVYAANAGVCLETQNFPDSPNHPEFPTTVLKCGETYRTQTSFTFFSR